MVKSLELRSRLQGFGIAFAIEVTQNMHTIISIVFVIEERTMHFPIG
jgi:hypothetical protein